MYFSGLWGRIFLQSTYSVFDYQLIKNERKTLQQYETAFAKCKDVFRKNQRLRCSWRILRNAPLLTNI